MLILLIVLALAWPVLSVGENSGSAPTDAPGAAASDPPGNPPDHITLTWTGDPATTMTVTWRADTTVANGAVEYRKTDAPEGSEERANATGSNFTTDTGASNLFTATLTGLCPSTRYTYRVSNGSTWSGLHGFSTADPKSVGFKFLIFGDSQSPPSGYDTWGKNLHGAYKANPDARFFVNVGDLVDVGQSGAHWNGWFEAAAGVIDSIPAMPTFGNHETGGATRTKRPAFYNAQFRLPQNGPAELKNQVYSYDYGPAHIVVLDSQDSEQKRYGDIIEPQRKWLEADLAASKAKWKFVFFHKGIYTLLKGRSYDALKQAFCPIMERYRVDCVFNAHDHGLARTYPLINDVKAASASGGTVYWTVGRSGTKFYTDIRKLDVHSFFYVVKDQPNYLVVDIVGSKMTINSMNADGTLIDSFYIDKKTDTNSDLIK